MSVVGYNRDLRLERTVTFTPKRSPMGDRATDYLLRAGLSRATGSWGKSYSDAIGADAETAQY